MESYFENYVETPLPTYGKFTLLRKLSTYKFLFFADPTWKFCLGQGRYWLSVEGQTTMIHKMCFTEYTYTVPHSYIFFIYILYFTPFWMKLPLLCLVRVSLTKFIRAAIMPWLSTSPFSFASAANRDCTSSSASLNPSSELFKWTSKIVVAPPDIKRFCWIISMNGYI